MILKVVLQSFPGFFGNASMLQCGNALMSWKGSCWKELNQTKYFHKLNLQPIKKAKIIVALKHCMLHQV